MDELYFDLSAPRNDLDRLAISKHADFHVNLAEYPENAEAPPLLPRVRCVFDLVLEQWEYRFYHEDGDSCELAITLDEAGAINDPRFKP